MYKIKNLKLHNFKFFFGEQNLRLDKKHTLIYGENGSGKSSLFWGIYTLLEASFKQPIETDKYFQPFGTNDNGVYILS